MRMPEISVEYILAIIIRAGLGLIFGFLCGLFALIATFWITPSTYNPPLWILALTTAAGCSASGFLAYYKPETPWRIVLSTFVIAIVGSYIGAWVGYWWGETFYPEGVRNVRLVAYGDIRSPPTIMFIVWATIGSTISGGAYYAYRAWRYHEV